LHPSHSLVKAPQLDESATEKTLRHPVTRVLLERADVEAAGDLVIARRKKNGTHLPKRNRVRRLGLYGEGCFLLRERVVVDFPRHPREKHVRQRRLRILARGARELARRELALPALPVFDAAVDEVVSASESASRDEQPDSDADRGDPGNDQNGEPPWLRARRGDRFG
jgi:hypothetical protein